ncbi:asparagine synthase-related protein [Streptomyces sp. NBC_01485]|uniref:asparagine synthase-related protein n=1 Tax=Streptomyces sp. NBC_01485 TaxID=2903884 RepID=UPI002E35C4C1|nr:asparagine synthase-related protein [Streptomyces sp. NBC_01485]
MVARTLPPATGFLALVEEDGTGRLPANPFAARATVTDLRDGTAAQPLLVRLLHSGAPDGALAHLDGLTVLLAGELYNRDELSSLLPEGSPSAEDAAVVAALFERYDVHAFRLLNGRFAALVVADGRAVLATDHAGSVPLYVKITAGRLLAATEAKALRTPFLGRPVTGARSVRGLPGVHQVEAGTVLDFSLGTGACVANRIWQPPCSRRILPEDEAVDAVRVALERAVRNRLDTTTPLVVISGGLDSSSVAALAARALGNKIDTVSMGTPEANEFTQAHTVAEHIGSVHQDITITTDELLATLPHTVWAAESLDPDIIEYLLPLTALYLRVGGAGRRILTGYGADIPLGGMHREGRPAPLDDAIARDMATFDGLNEMTPTLSAVAGHWTTHPYWDRDVLDVLVPLEAGLKSRYGQDKWVLRAAMGDILPRETVLRPKLGVHEGAGVTSAFSRMLADHGVPHERLHDAKRMYVKQLFDQVVAAGAHPGTVDVAAHAERVGDLVRSKAIR